MADALTRQTLLGAATLLSESGEDPAVLAAFSLSEMSPAELRNLADRG